MEARRLTVGAALTWAIFAPGLAAAADIPVIEPVPQAILTPEEVAALWKPGQAGHVLGPGSPDASLAALPDLPAGGIPAHSVGAEDADDNRSQNTSLRVNEVTPVDVPGCSIQSYVAFMYLNQAVVSIPQSVQDCEHEFELGSETQRVCTADILGVIQGFWNTAAYLASLATLCVAGDPAEANCAAQIMAWVGCLTETMQAIISSFQTCALIGKPGVAVEEVSENVVRRLETQLSVKGAEGGRGAANATRDGEPQRRLGNGQAHGLNGMNGGWCFVNVGQILAYIMQAGWLIDVATGDCEVQTTESDKAGCAADVASIVAAISDIVSYVGGAASLCGETVNLEALCTGDMGTLGNGLAGLAAASSVMVQSCEAVASKAPSPHSRFSKHNYSGHMERLHQHITEAQEALPTKSPAPPKAPPSGKELVDEVFPGATKLV